MEYEYAVGSLQQTWDHPCSCLLFVTVTLAGVGIPWMLLSPELRLVPVELSAEWMYLDSICGCGLYYFSSDLLVKGIFLGFWFIITGMQVLRDHRVSSISLLKGCKLSFWCVLTELFLHIHMCSRRFLKDKYKPSEVSYSL